MQESFGYMCYANNSVGYAQKVFHLNIEFAPEFISGDDRDQNLTVKLHHSFALNCKTNAYPEATTYWSFVSKQCIYFNLEDSNDNFKSNTGFDKYYKFRQSSAANKQRKQQA